MPDDDIEDSDDGLYDDTDEDEDEDIYDDDDDKSEVSSMASAATSGVMMEGGEKKVATPRQHFKCSQCDKLFFGPLKFKSKSRAPDKVHISISITFISLPNPMFDHLLESSGQIKK